MHVQFQGEDYFLPDSEKKSLISFVNQLSVMSHNYDWRLYCYALSGDSEVKKALCMLDYKGEPATASVKINNMNIQFTIDNSKSLKPNLYELPMHLNKEMSLNTLVAKSCVRVINGKAGIDGDKLRELEDSINMLESLGLVELRTELNKDDKEYIVVTPLYTVNSNLLTTKNTIMPVIVTDYQSKFKNYRQHTRINTSVLGLECGVKANNKFGYNLEASSSLLMIYCKFVESKGYIPLFNTKDDLVDTRGRSYIRPALLNHKGDDMRRAMMCFRAEPINKSI